ncbi:ABC transporter substrate-binding protein, partial [Candidatus Entotheonella serta]
MKTLCGLLAVLGLLAAPAVAADKVKIGFVTTLTTPAGVIGKDMVDAVNLAMEH